LNQYEGMYLFDPTFGASWENCEGEVRRLMDRAGAEIILSGTKNALRTPLRVANVACTP